MSKPHEVGCLVCGDTSRRITRGLCSKHYDRFNTKLKGLPTAQALAFEQRCIEEGWVLPKMQGQRPKTDDDPFDEVLAEVIAEGHSEITAAEQQHQFKKTTKKTTQKKRG